MRLAQGDRRCLPYIGYRRFGSVGLRVDCVEKLATLARKKARQGPFLATPELVVAAGCDGDDLVTVMSGLGFRAVVEDMGIVYSPARKRRPRRPQRASRKTAKSSAQLADSPFAVLRELNGVK